MALFGLPKDSLEYKVKAKIVYDAQKEKKASGKKKASDSATKALNGLQFKAKKLEYESKRDGIIPKVANRMIKTWEDWNKKSVELRDKQAKAEEFETEKNALKALETVDIDEIIKGFIPTIVQYKEDAEKLKPKFGKSLTVDDEVNFIKTQANEKYVELVKIQKKLAKKVIEAQLMAQKLQQLADKKLQEMAEIPLSLEQKIDDAKAMLDALLGKLALPMYNPDLPDFDVDAIMAAIKALINPVLASTMPLTAIVGKIPILGDLIGLMTTIQTGSGQASASMTEEQKKLAEELLKKGLQIDPTIKAKITGVIDDIILFCMTLPSILIQVIFSMLDMIYSKLKIIMSIVPLGSLFPLSLVPAAINSVPKILNLIKALPGMIHSMLEGVIKKTIAEAMALAKPKPPQIPYDALFALANNMKAQKMLKKKDKTYNDISLEFYNSNKLKEIGYALTQVKNIQSNYLRIFNGKDNVPPSKITLFVDNGKDQVLPNSTAQSFGEGAASMLNSFTGSLGAAVDAGISLAGFGEFGVETNAEGATTTNVSGPKDGEDSGVEPGFIEKLDEIERKKATVDDYKAYLDKLLAASNSLSSSEATGLSCGLVYYKLVSTERLVGEWYPPYKDQVVGKYKNEVVLQDVL